MLGGILRRENLEAIEGGMANVFSKHLLTFFAGPHTFDKSGITVHTPHGVVIIFAKLGTVIADEAALKSMWSCKGSAGHRPCLLCSNVVSKRSEL